MKIYYYNGSANICGKRVREAREKLNLTQEELAARLQVNEIKLLQKAISRIEAGERVVADYELMHLAKALKVDVLWLLGE